MDHTTQIPAPYLSRLLNEAHGALCDADDIVQRLDPSVTDDETLGLVRQIASMRRLLDHVEAHVVGAEAEVIEMRDEEAASAA